MENAVPGLKSALKNAGITQSELASKMGVALVTVSRWVRGEVEPPISTLKEIAQILDCTLYELLGLSVPSVAGCRISDVQEKDGQRIMTVVIEQEKRTSRMTRPLSGELIYLTLSDISPEAFAAACESTKREEQWTYEVIGIKRGRIKKRIAAEGIKANDFDRYRKREEELLEEAGFNTLCKACDRASDAYSELRRPIKYWKCHALALTGWTHNLYHQREVTLDDINAMLAGVEDYEHGTVTLEDGRVFSQMQNDSGTYYSDDGSVISAIDLIRTDEDGEPCKVEARLGYILVGDKDTYDAMPY